MAKQRLPLRSEVADEHKWALDHIFPTHDAWETELARLRQEIPQLKRFRGTLKTPEKLAACLTARDQLMEAFDSVAAYAFMGKDQDNADETFQRYADMATSLSMLAAESTAFIEPEILTLDPAVVQDWVQTHDSLKTYRHYLMNILRMQPHTLSQEQEELLAGTVEMAQTASNVFRMFNDADLTFPNVTNENGDEVELTHGRYLNLMESQDRRVREEAFGKMYATYGEWKNTLAATYTSAVKGAQFYARARNYASSLEAALDADNVEPRLYENLIEVVHEHLPLFYRYVDLRKRLLELDEMHMYDVYVPMVKDVDLQFSHQEAMDTVAEGLAPLGERYTGDLRRGFSSRWIDWFENRGKTSGAYSWGAYGVHPFVLMNYQNNVDTMFTLAHEMGHAMHSFYSDSHQDFVNSHYTIFVAEVASTVNECLVMDHMLQKTHDKQVRMFLLNHYLEQFRGTVFRQTMFAEFEMLVHRSIGGGEPMTAEGLSRLYYDLNAKYFGAGVVVDKLIEMEWARIPHFYRPFYVYKYATGFSAAVALSRQILNGKPEAANRYLDFLKSGGSDYPVELLRRAGVDMRTAQPAAEAMKVFDQLLTEMETLAAD